jgi:hypothetical protein
VGELPLHNFELALYLLPSLADLGGDEGEVTSVPLQQLHQDSHLLLTPKGRCSLLCRLLNNPLMLLPSPILESDLIDEGLNGRN